MFNGKRIAATAFFLIFSVIILCLGFSYFGVLPKLDLSEFINIDLIGKTTPVSSVSNETVISQLKADIISAENEKELPDDMKALWVDIEKDIVPASDDDTEAVKYAVYSDFNYYRNFVPNTIFVKPDLMGRFDGLKEPDGSDYDVLAYLLYYVRDINCDAFLVADEDMVTDNDFSLLREYLDNYDFKGILLSVPSLYGKNEYYELTEELSAFVRLNYPSVAFGVEVVSDFDALLAEQQVINIFEADLVDFGYVDCNTTTANTVNSFQNVALWWNSFAAYYEVPFYCEHRADLIFTDDSLWGYSNEINLQLKALFNCPDFDGSCFYRVSSLKNKKALARDLSIFLNDVTASAQDTFSVDSLSLTDNKVTFSGTSISDTYNLYCNDSRILVNDNIFTESISLLPGLNTFKFFSNGGRYTYRIYDNSPLINSYYPSQNTDVSQVQVLSPYAVCPESAEVYAVFDGKYYLMEKTVSDNIEVPNGFCVYSCNIELSQNVSYNNTFSVLCSYNGQFSDVNCCKILSNGSVAEESENVFAEQKVSPYTDNGLGSSLMCILNSDNTEQISEVDDYDTYHPYNSSLLKGTIDYVDRITVSAEGYLRYELKSGINVYGTDCILVNNGYNLPRNNVKFLSVDDLLSDKTVLTFETDWLSPITVTPQMLDYEVGYQSFSFNISEFDAEYIDVKFYYANSVDFASELSFSSESVFSHYELYKDNSDNIIIRMYLKRPGDFYGYDIIETDDGHIQLSFKKRISNDINGKVIMLDPGHGGISMTGTALADNSVWEAQITLAIALKTKSYLEAMGAKVLMTRISDIGMDLYERAVMCEENDPDIFVSIHCDGTDSAAESGTHTFYYTPYSQPLASCIHNSLVNAYKNGIYVESDENFARIDRKIKYYPFYVTRIDNCPSVLVETGFLSNLTEGYVLANPTNQDILAKAISDGISTYFYHNY